MPPQQGYISKQFQPVDDGAKTPMAICKHCNDKKVAKNIVIRKINHLAFCDAYYEYLQALLNDDTSDVGDKELVQLPQDLKEKIELRTEQPLISKSNHAAAQVANQQAVQSELHDTLMDCIYRGSLPFDAFEPNKHPGLVRLCRMIIPDFVPPSRLHVAQAMLDLSTQPSPAEAAYAQELSEHAVLSSRIVNDLLYRETPQSTPGSKRPFDLV
jgi:hypothetical protein